MTNENTYREGDEDVVELPTAMADSSSEEVAEEAPAEVPADDEKGSVASDVPADTKEAVQPATAVLLVLYPDGRVEAAVSLPNMNLQHMASMTEVRDLCHSVYCDMNTTILGKAAAHESSAALQKAFAHVRSNQMQQMIKGGRGGKG